MRHPHITVFIALQLSLACATAFAGDSAPAAKAPLDVTMDIVPLNADVEKSVVQNITVPPTPRPVAPPKQASRQPAAAHAAATRPAGAAKPGDADEMRESAARQAAEARHEAAEAAAEARKDRNNSSTPDNDGPPPG